MQVLCLPVSGPVLGGLIFVPLSVVVTVGSRLEGTDGYKNGHR